MNRAKLGYVRGIEGRTAAAAAMLAVCGVLVAACGSGGPLDGLGDASSGFVRGDPATTTTLAAVSSDLGALVATDQVLWWNDELDDQATGSADAVIARVWDRRAGSRFVQASRAEIAAALPTVRFPEAVPADTRWITSQLVYDLDTGTLDRDTSAAFGLWRVEPYTVAEGSVMVLRVGAAPDDTPSSRSDVTPILVPEGLSLVWTEAGLRYELFCRSTLTEDVCFEVADSSSPLGSQLRTTGATG